MGFVLFYYTLFVMLASILASATCLSAYLVSHRREMMFAVFGFLFYFFDVAWVLQDDFALLAICRWWACSSSSARWCPW